MLKSYLRYNPTDEGSFGVIVSPQCRNAVYDSTGSIVFTGALQQVKGWNLRQAQLACALSYQTTDTSVAYAAQSEVVTSLAAATSGRMSGLVAAGYSSGTIRIFNYTAASSSGSGSASALVATLRGGHTASVSCLQYSDAAAADNNNSSSGSLLLASGGADGNIVLWDCAADYRPVCKLRGHKNEVTGLVFVRVPVLSHVDTSFAGISGKELLVSVSKDTLLKVWEVEDTMSCIQTVVGHRCEIWSIAATRSTSNNNINSSNSNNNNSSSAALVVTGASDEFIRGYQLHPDIISNDALLNSTTATTTVVTSKQSSEHSNSNSTGAELEVLVYFGAVQRSGSAVGGHVAAVSDKCSFVQFSPDSRCLAVQAGTKAVAFFRVRSAEEMRRLLKRRSKKQKKQQKKRAASELQQVDEETLQQQQQQQEGPRLEDAIEFVHLSRFSAKVKSAAFSPRIRGAATVVSDNGSSGGVLQASYQAMIALSNNTLELHQVKYKGSDSSTESDTEEATTAAVTVAKASIIDWHGHRSDVRGIALSADGLTLVTCSPDSVKLWTRNNSNSNSGVHVCSATVAVDGYALCVAFAPGASSNSGGGRFAIVGNQESQLQIIDFSSGEIIWTGEHRAAAVPTSSRADFDDDNIAAAAAVDDAAAAATAVWGVAVRPDGTGFMSGGGRTVCFWDFVVSSTGLQATLARQLRVSHDVMSLCYSPTRTAAKLFVAVGLLDSTVKVYFDDSLKFFLSLYGHKLPVLSVDISSDNTLLVSGSADKSVKIWGLDFGDCHRSLLAHADSVTAVRFQPHTHYFFSAGKDGTVKYWDADRFEQILSLCGSHSGSCWSLAVSPAGMSADRHGARVYSAGQDRCIRVWQRSTDDLVFIEEEKERVMEAQVAASIAQQSSDDALVIDAADGPVSSDPAAALAAVTSSSVESVKGGEAIMDALDLIAQEPPPPQQQQQQLSDAKPSQNPLLLGLSPHKYLLLVLRRIAVPDLENSLLVLPFHYVVRLLAVLIQLAERGLDIELCSRCAVQLLRCHQAPLLQSQNSALLVPQMLQRLRAVLGSSVSGYRDLIGTNLAGLRFLVRKQKETAENQQAFA